MVQGVAESLALSGIASCSEVYVKSVVPKT